MSYNKIKYNVDLYFSFPIEVFIHYCLQTLTELNLSHNRIGVQGAEYLAKALQENKVENILIFLFVL